MSRAKEHKLFEPTTLPMDLDFAAEIGRLRVLEDDFLKAEDLQRLASSSTSFHERADILEKAGYTGEGSLEERVLRHRDQEDLLLREFSRDSDLDLFLLLDLDYHNLKAIIRYLQLELRNLQEKTEGLQIIEKEAEQAQGDVPKTLDEMLRKTAPTPIPHLFDTVIRIMRGISETEDNIPYNMRPQFYKHIKSVVAKASDGSDLSAADWLADQLYFEELKQIGEEKSFRKMKDFTDAYRIMLAEHANFEIFLRMKRAGKSREFFKRAFVPHGTTQLEAFLGAYDDVEKSRALFADSPISEGFPTFPDYNSSEDVAVFGKNKDKLYSKVIARGKMENQHAWAIAAFWLAKKLEQKNIRIILQAVSRNMDTEEILAMLRPTYKEASL